MRVSGLTPTGDWRFGRGKANYLRKSDAIKQSVVTRLRSFTRDWYLDVDANVDWIGLLSTRGILVDTIRRRVERVVRKTEGVARINRIAVDLDRADRKVTIELDIVDVYGAQINITGLQV